MTADRKLDTGSPPEGIWQDSAKEVGHGIFIHYCRIQTPSGLTLYGCLDGPSGTILHIPLLHIPEHRRLRGEPMSYIQAAQADSRIKEEMGKLNSRQLPNIHDGSHIRDLVGAGNDSKLEYSLFTAWGRDTDQLTREAICVNTPSGLSGGEHLAPQLLAIEISRDNGWQIEALYCDEVEAIKEGTLEA